MEQENMSSQFERQHRNTNKSDVIFIFFIFWIASAYFLYSFFAKNIPNGQYLTNQVRVYDSTNKDELFLNLIVTVENGEYYVNKIIVPSTGKAVEVEEAGNTLGQKCQFKIPNGTGSRHSAAATAYTVTIYPKDIQISLIEHIENDITGFIISVIPFTFMTYMLINSYKKRKNP